MPSGVIVLVDEDIEAYFYGRLEFISPDDNLETEQFYSILLCRCAIQRIGFFTNNPLDKIF